MPNDSTTRGYELPHPDNIAREDAERVRSAIQKIDTDIGDLAAREVPVASEEASGRVRLATLAEASAGTSSDAVPVVLRVKSMIVAAVNALSDILAGEISDLNSAKMAKSANLSDLSDKSAARTALELGTAALKGIASAAGIRSKSGANLVSVDAAWDAAQWVFLGNIAGAVSIDLSTGARFYGVLTGNVTIDVTNMKDGQPVEIALIQDATGGRTVSWATKFKWPSAAAPEVATAANNYAVVVTGVCAWASQNEILCAGWKVTA